MLFLRGIWMLYMLSSVLHIIPSSYNSIILFMLYQRSTDSAMVNEVPIYSHNDQSDKRTLQEEEDNVSNHTVYK